VDGWLLKMPIIVKLVINEICGTGKLNYPKKNDLMMTG
jgi:hypothetical protein